MSVLPILRWPDARLATVCEPVTDFKAVTALAQNMLETMYAAPGRGLAAPQVGVLARMFVMDASWKDGPATPIVCINPEIVAASDTRTCGEEACLSIPDVSAEVERHSTITLRWQDVDATWHQAELSGFESICAQHEYDHLDGLVIFDRLEGEARLKLEKDYEAVA
ncbi:peptide deformylase [uncultured Shimia sp.]|uniref:peptide deformylase n=1 Tax=uncultured Shimia sp. TaxID=573152 RepID=UPI002629D5B8|nr:peptide deformylase [uncultured Shimia sp.]